MTPFSTLADTCDPSLPGCNPESYAPVVIGSLLVALAFLLIVAGIVVLVVILIVRGRRKRNAASGGGSEVPGASTGSQAPASWQADPTRRFRWRWWDGRSWTDNVSDGGPPQIDRGDETHFDPQ
ncbi:MAG: hypothetical protein WBB44_00975 [Candidatus Nanopelagicales bacterium]|nr:DUF2510 domain-containing protein [Candidatus Nanopelagicales bacterium]